MRVGFYECDITPPLGVCLNGYFRIRKASDVCDKLYAKAVVIEDENKVVALLVADICDLPAQMREVITSRICAYTDIPKENICVCANHAHTGAPVLDGFCGERKDDAYVDVFYRLCADAVILAYKRMSVCNASFGKEAVEDICYNRDYILSDGTLKTWTRERNGAKSIGITDPDLSIVLFEEHGIKKGAIINYSCHQDTMTHEEESFLSGDYSSVISKRLKEKYGNDFVSLFVIGACGDINHVPYNPDARISEHYEIGNKLADSALNAIDKAQPVYGSVDIMIHKIKVQKRELSREQLNEKVINWMQNDPALFRVKRIIEYAVLNQSCEDELIIQGILIGNIFLACLPGEMYVKYGLQIKKNSPFDNNVVLEFCNSSCGYVPTQDAFGETSDLYEASPSMSNCYVPQAGDQICTAALKIADELYVRYSNGGEI